MKNIFVSATVKTLKISREKMDITFKTGINRTRIFIAFVILCSVFDFSVTAQINNAKPMANSALTALMEDLKRNEYQIKN